MELNKALSWEIDNFSERNDEIKSDPFSSGGCKWCLSVYPKGYLGHDDLILFMRDADTESLRPGWKRRARFCFVLLNQSGQKLYNVETGCKLFCAEVTGWGHRTELTLTELQEKGFLENNQLTIQVYIQVLEVVHQGNSTHNDMVDYYGVQVIAYQFHTVYKTLKEHPDFALDLIRKKQEVQTTYLKLVIGLIQTLIINSPRTLSLTELSNAQSELSELTEAGFKLDLLKSKLEEVSLESKKEWMKWLSSTFEEFSLESNKARVQQLEERVKDLKVELEKEKIKSAAAAATISSFEFIDFLIKRFFLSCFSISKH